MLVSNEQFMDMAISATSRAQAMRDTKENATFQYNIKLHGTDQISITMLYSAESSRAMLDIERSEEQSVPSIWHDGDDVLRVVGARHSHTFACSSKDAAEFLFEQVRQNFIEKMREVMKGE